jgi:uncharacterized protein YhaN
MRLRRLNLERFGHFTEKSYDFGAAREGASDFHIVFGPNEAGKTTTMEAFLRLLYGFPLRDSYAFKHQRPNLRISGVLEMNGAEQVFTRLPSKSGNLLNARGDAVPETALTGALCGLTEDDYRKLLCLDDETIEAGGKEIADSKGDIGRLLFGAASGMSDLSVVLGDVEARAGAFYKKGGSKSELAQLKRELEDVSTQIKDLDVSALQYRKLREDLASALEQEEKARAHRKDAFARQARLSAVIKAIPLMQRLAGLEAELVPLVDYPETLDIDPEELVNLLTRRVQLGVQQQSLTDEIEAKTVARDGVDRRPELIVQLTKLEALREARGRFDTAQIDLPKRRDARDTAVAEMARGLQDIGLDPARVADGFRVSDVALGQLDASAEAVRAAEITVAQASIELQTAQTRADQTAQVEQGDGSTGPDLKALLERENAERVFEEFNAAQAALRLSERGLRNAMGGLTHKGQHFDVAPVVTTTPAEASGLAREIAQAEADLRAAREDAADVSARVDGFARQVAVYQSADLISDEAALALRAERETLWQAHLSAMESESAGAFETALRADDRSTTARQSQAKDLGELRQVKLALAEAEAKLAASERRIDTIGGRLGAAQARFVSAVNGVGLTEEITPEAFADWVVAATRCAELARADTDERASQASFIAAGAALEARLAEMLEEDGAGLEALLKRARSGAEAQAAAAFAMQAARKARDEAVRELALRKAALERGQAQVSAVLQDWAAAVEQHLGAQVDAERLRGAMSGLRGLSGVQERLRAVERQIAGMEADQATFVKALTEIFGAAPVSVQAAMESLERDGAAARAAQETWVRLSGEIEQAEHGRAAATANLADLEARVALLSGGFAPEIPVESLEELRAAVSVAQRAIGLRAQAAQIGLEICTLLGAASLVEAREELENHSLDQARAEHAEIEHDLAAIEIELTSAIEARTARAAALSGVTGVGDIAILVARKRAIEAQMQAGIMGYLEDRLGHMLADRAIRSYRDMHRSGMMQAAELAFRDLTSGAYTGLTTQPEGTAETLVAIQGSDGAAKQAHAMSKGTRFQLYLALRAAAYSQMAENGAVLPFFCDDVFETFDDTRTRAACHLMHRIGLRGQAIYLTHHQHVVDIARDVCGADVTVHHV